MSDERELIKISYPHIDNFWQEGKKPARGGNAFRCLYVSAHILLKNLNEKEYLPYVGEITGQIYDECVEEIMKWQNCPDEEELNYAIQNYEHHKCQTIQRLYNVFWGLNERIHKVNHYKPEEEKKMLCAYYILTRYKRQLIKYLDLTKLLLQKVQQLEINYKKEKLENVLKNIKYVFSESERKLLEEFLGKQDEELSKLIKDFNNICN